MTASFPPPNRPYQRWTPLSSAEKTTACAVAFPFKLWCRNSASNRGHPDLQSGALPAELPRHVLRLGMLASAVSSTN
jgi:hypothetical protein